MLHYRARRKRLSLIRSSHTVCVRMLDTIGRCDSIHWLLQLDLSGEPRSDHQLHPFFGNSHVGYLPSPWDVIWLPHAYEFGYILNMKMYNSMVRLEGRLSYDCVRTLLHTDITYRVRWVEMKKDQILRSQEVLNAILCTGRPK